MHLIVTRHLVFKKKNVIYTFQLIVMYNVPSVRFHCENIQLKNIWW